MEQKKQNPRTLFILLGVIGVIFLVTVLFALRARKEKEQPPLPSASASAVLSAESSPTAPSSSASAPVSTAEPTAAPTPVSSPTATATPSPTAAPAPTPAPPSQISTQGLSTAGEEWSFGYWKNEYDENGVRQAVYELEADQVAKTAGYSVITGHTGEKKVYLTMDEGYENGYTPAILDVLKQKGVKAAFFLTGEFVDENADLVQRMYREGHTIGNHTNRHPLMADLSEEKFKAELTELEQKVSKALGTSFKPRYYRPPQGYFSQRDLALAGNMGYTTVFWSFAYDDYSKPNESTEDSRRKACLQIVQSAHDGEVLLLHAISKTNTMVLGDVIDRYRERGYTFATLDEYPR